MGQKSVYFTDFQTILHNLWSILCNPHEQNYLLARFQDSAVHHGEQPKINLSPCSLELQLLLNSELNIQVASNLVSMCFLKSELGPSGMCRNEYVRILETTSRIRSPIILYTAPFPDAPLMLHSNLHHVGDSTVQQLLTYLNPWLEFLILSITCFCQRKLKGMKIFPEATYFEFLFCLYTG